MSDDPFAILAGEPATAEALAAARSQVDALLWRRDVRAAASEVAAASIERGGRASAAIDGADVVVEDESPMGRVLRAALRITAAVSGQVDVFERSPLQAFAHLHAVVASGFDLQAELGRPRVGTEADDPLHLGPAPSPTEASERLTRLARFLVRPTEAPALLVAAITHAEIAAVRPFRWGSGLMARASTRLVLAARGVDPSLFGIPEHGMHALGRPSYVAALRGYATGSPEGVSRWVVWHSRAVEIGAGAVVVP